MKRQVYDWSLCVGETITGVQEDYNGVLIAFKDKFIYARAARDGDGDGDLSKKKIDKQNAKAMIRLENMGLLNEKNNSVYHKPTRKERDWLKGNRTTFF